MTATISEIRIVRLFVSSPSDVKQERERIDRVVERLNNSFAGLLRIETVRSGEKILYRRRQLSGANSAGERL